jgi:predicted TIM-barrel fold metal-dependent hydrolase
MPGDVIDVWAQAAPGEAFAGPQFARLIQQSHAEGRVEAARSGDGVIAAMDAAEVGTALLSAWYLPGHAMISNEQVASLVEQHPKRFVGVASVDPTDPVAATAEVDRAVRVLGFKALRVLPWVWSRPPTDPLFYPLFVKCVELDIPFCTQVGHTGPLMPSDVGRPIPYIDQIALTFPRLKIVCGHIGYPWTDEMISLAWKHRNVFIDTSAYRPRYYPPQLLTFMSSYGQDKVMFGTNFPMLSFEDCVGDARALKLPQDILTKFLRRNAERVFGLTGGA